MGINDILTAKEAAELLRVNVKSIYEAVKKNEIPHLRMNKVLRFSRKALLLSLAGAEKGDTHVR